LIELAWYPGLMVPRARKPRARDWLHLVLPVATNIA
jgi:hypothetical protein